LLALVLLAGAPCSERACFVTAASKCAATRGSLPIVDWSGMFGVEAKGRTEISVKPGEGGACVVTLDLVVVDFKPKTDIPKQKAIDRLNANPRHHVRCSGTTDEAVKLLTLIGTEKAGFQTLAACKPTRCAPLPPLEPGCQAGACRDGAYPITCGERTCSMTGVDKDALAEGMLYGCADMSGEIRTKSR
jgi:hypothetical protein